MSRGSGGRTGASRTPAVRWALPLLLFVSGATAVVYEVAWQRQFALVFGSAAPATAAVLAAYFAGLGLGSLWLGQGAGRWERPLRVYAALEVVIGVGALSIRPLLRGCERVYPWLSVHAEGHPGWFTVARAGLSFVALLVPTLAMGGTLPVLARWMDRGQRRLGVEVGILYASNTAGAALGALAFPFVLLPWAGIFGTTVLCVLVNLAVAGGAWWLDRNELPCPEAVAPAPAPAPAPAAVREKADRQPIPVSGAVGSNPFILGASFVSGLATFALQVQWNRAFAQVHENSVHAFALIVFAFILALAVGAQLARRVLRRNGDPRRSLALCWALGGGMILGCPWLFWKLTDGLRLLGASTAAAAPEVRLAGLALAVVFVPAMLLGTGLPLIMEAAGRSSGESVGRLLGRLLAANIAGCVAGALLAGFVLPRVLGLWSAMASTGALMVTAAVVLAPGVRVAKRAHWATAAVVGLAALAVAHAAGKLPRVRVLATQGERVVAVREGAFGVVAVTERAGSRRLKLNNHYGLGGTLSVGDQRFQAHLPLLLHPAPARVGVLGLGTGITAGGCLFHPVRQVEVVELVPEVVTSAREAFNDEAAGLFTDARVRVRVEDARNHLRAGAGPYDVILGDLVVPWRQGEGALFTREHIAAARQALAPGGVFCQWLPMFQLGETDLRILLRTFLSVFPHASVWRGDFAADRPAIALVGFQEPFHVDPMVVARRLAEMRPDPQNPQLTEPFGLWLNYVGVLEPGDLDATEQRINTEDRPWIETLGSSGRGADPRSRFVVGRSLQRWLADVRGRSEGRGETLTPAERRAGAAGDVLFEFSVRLAEGDSAGAAKLRIELQRQLTPTVYRAIFGAGP